MSLRVILTDIIARLRHLVWSEYQTGEDRTDCRSQRQRLVRLGFALCHRRAEVT
jgi:hypothetical protein